jgi:hypothetical protein
VLHPKPLRYSGFILDHALDPGQQWLTALAPGPAGGEVADPTGGLDHPRLAKVTAGQAIFLLRVAMFLLQRDFV